MQVIDDVMSLRERFCGGDDIIKHRRDFDWLLEAVTKVYTIYCVYSKKQDFVTGTRILQEKRCKRIIFFCL